MLSSKRYCDAPQPGQLHSDLDSGDGSVEYMVSGEGAGTVFTVDGSTGDLHALRRLDRETKAQYMLRARALHRHTGLPLEPDSQFTIRIQDVNDNEPKFLDGPYQATVPEMSALGKLTNNRRWLLTLSTSQYVN